MAKRVDADVAARGLVAVSVVLAGVFGGHVALEGTATFPTEGWLSVVLGGSGAPTLSHLFSGGPSLIALGIVLMRRRAVSTPFPAVSTSLATLIGLIWMAVVFSPYRWSALVGALEWTSYGAGLLAIVASGGRGGSVLFLRAVAVGAGMSALMALRQYGEMRGLDPNFRVQGPWNNPNALAAYLVLGVGAGVAQLGACERLSRLFSVLGIALMLAAAALTGSKGGAVALAVGGASWIGLTIFFRPPTWRVATVAVVGSIVIAAALVAAATRSPSGGSPAPAYVGGAAARALSGGAEGTQSFAFRRLLWRTALDLARREPAVGGINSFGPRSTKPGYVTQTVLAHSTPLQLSAETTPIGGIAFVLLFVSIVGISLRGARSLHPRRKEVLAGTLAALIAGLVHNFVDSDAYFFGLGITLFGLGGVALIAASDATVPELVPSLFRSLGAGLGATALLLWVYVGAVDLLAAQARGLVLTGEREAGIVAARDLSGLAPWDPRPFALLALADPGPDVALASARRAYRLSPTPKSARAVANLLLRAEDFGGAIAAANDALRLDPNNFAALALAREAALRMGDVPAAVRFARRAIAIEGTTYDAVRSQPEFVPTAVAEARLFLAERTNAPAERADLLVRAVRDLARYARTTVPVIARQDAAEPGAEIAGESRVRAEEILALGRKGVAQARLDLPARDQRRGELDAAEEGFAAAEALLRRASSAR